ncbi:MAG TPA: NAD(+) diphosphatase [Capsulimonadaceae bacterium]|jgi:NAD+ diphosphatase
MTLTNFTRAYPSTAPVPGERTLLLFHEKLLLVIADGDSARFPVDAEIGGMPDLTEPLYLGDLAGKACLAVVLQKDASIPDSLTPMAMRDLYGALSDVEYALAGYASQIVHWQATSAFCPVCGHATKPQAHDWGKVCPNCEHTSYPRVSPAVLALVHDGDRILLSHKEGWGPRYSILAGFVEPGESLEECVRREVREEAGVEVTDIVYAGSQPWPFPHQLMIGFNAQYAGGDIVIDTTELDDARWFHIDGMPDLPGPSSLSRRLIDNWMTAKHKR